jgi:putative tryptophan/tyrosine transport system substrate-binding protein
MRRRAFLGVMGGMATVWPLLARSQPSTVRQVHIGLLTPTPLAPAMLSAFRNGMRERGYVEGQNLSIAVHSPRGSFEQNPDIVAELVNGNVDVIRRMVDAGAGGGSQSDVDNPNCDGVGGRSGWVRVRRQSRAARRQYHGN